MILRSASVSDIPAVLGVWNPIIRDTLAVFSPLQRTAPEVAQLIQDKATQGFAFLVVVQDDRMLGFATYGQFRAGAGYAHSMEHTIMLAPGARGRGTGRALMAAIEDHARRRKAHSMMAGVSAANPEGIAFHGALGYAHVARIPQVGRRDGQWLDLVLMQKFL